jgi:hypothetical protein
MSVIITATLITVIIIIIIIIIITTTTITTTTTFDQIKVDELEGHVARVVKMRNSSKTLVGKLEGMRPLGRPSRR